VEEGKELVKIGWASPKESANLSFRTKPLAAAAAVDSC